MQKKVDIITVHCLGHMFVEDINRKKHRRYGAFENMKEIDK